MRRSAPGGTGACLELPLANLEHILGRPWEPPKGDKIQKELDDCFVQQHMGFLVNLKFWLYTLDLLSKRNQLERSSYGKRGVGLRQLRPITEHSRSDRITGVGESRGSSEDQKNGDTTSKSPLDNVRTDDTGRLPSGSSGIRLEISPRGCLGVHAVSERWVRSD